MSDNISRARAAAAEIFGHDHAGHDIDHLDRVHGLCTLLAATEGGDPEVLGVAVYVHDMHRILEKQGSSAGVEDAILDLLRRAGVDAELHDKVLECVACTGSYSFSSAPRTGADRILEGRILRDADVLDALGAIGIARAFMYGGMIGEPIWVPGIPVEDTYTRGKTTSIVHHFHEKLLKIAGDMWTDKGRELAVERTEYMRGFLDRLLAEWDQQR